MGFLDYSNETQTNIFPKENFEELVQEVFDIVATNISRSLGPLGSSATILQGMLEPEATKDGYSILCKYAFRNDYKKMIYNLIKAPCTRMNNIVGDGTTTAITLTNAMFSRYKLRYNTLNTLFRLPRQFVRTWDSVIEELQNRIADKATAIDPTDYETIYNLAYVTSNGNEEVSRTIAKVYSEVEAPFIKQKDSPTNKSYIETVIGFNFPANLISDAYARNQDMTSEETNFAVMVFNFKLERDFFETVMIKINEVLKAKGKKLLIIAPAYDAKMCDELIAQYTMMERRSAGGINMILAQYSTSELTGNQLLDLCTILKCKVINDKLADDIMAELLTMSADNFIQKLDEEVDYKLTRTIGKASYGLLSTTAGALIRSEDDITEDEFYEVALTSAKNTLNTLMSQTDVERKSYSHKIHLARERVLQLEMKNFIYYVGADSKLQKNILWDSIMDVIKCLRSAVRCGVVPGCQLSIITSCDEMLEDLSKDKENTDDMTNDDLLKAEIINIIKFACVDVYRQVLSGPDDMGIIKLLPRWQYTTEEGVDALVKEAGGKVVDIINKSIESNSVFDMESLEYNKNIITSAETDQLVLLAASELIKILISGNQAIIIREDVDSSHEEQYQM